MEGIFHTPKRLESLTSSPQGFAIRGCNLHTKREREEKTNRDQINNQIDIDQQNKIKRAIYPYFGSQLAGTAQMRIEYLQRRGTILNAFVKFVELLIACCPIRKKRRF